MKDMSPEQQLLPEDMSPEQQVLPEPPGTDFVCGDPQVEPRIGNEYQVEIPPMLLNPADVANGLSDCFLMGSAIPIMWVQDGEHKDGDEAQGGQENPVDAVDMNESLKSIKARRNRVNAENKKKSKKSTCKMRLVPDCSTGPWEDAEVGRFLLGLYIFGKNFNQVKKFMETRGIGEILSFYYGKFYKSEKYLRWSESKKTRSRKCVFGRKIFSGWRLQELLTRLIRLLPDPKEHLVEVSKSYAEGNISLEKYVDSLKAFVGIDTLVEAIAIGMGKEDLTSLTVEPVKTHQWFTVCSNLPVGKACSSLTSGDIIKYLTGGTRLSKARCNDIFWEAIWPRLLANGWHSEQPQYQSYVCSKDCLVFLVPGIQKFSKRDLVKGDHYFDSVTDILAKVVSEPELLEFETEDIRSNGCDAEDDSAHEAPSSQDSPPDHRARQYLKSPVSKPRPSQIKFTIMDTSEANVFGIRELKYGEEADSGAASKVTGHKRGDSRRGNNQVASDKLSSDCEKRIDKSEAEGKSSNINQGRMRFTIVDTSLVNNEGKTFELRELTDSVMEFSQNMKMQFQETKRKSSECLLHKHRQRRAGPALDSELHCNDKKRDPDTDATETRLNSDLGAASSPSVIGQSNQDQKANGSDAHQSNREQTEQHFMLRTKPRSVNSSSSGPSKRRRLSACVRTEVNRLAENHLVNPDMEIKKPRVVFRINGSKAMAPEMNNKVNPESDVPKDLNMIPNPVESRTAQPPSGNPECGQGADSDSPCSIAGHDPLETNVSGPENNAAQEILAPTLHFRRQSTRKRPLTTKVLEALESGFLLKKSSTSTRKRPQPSLGPSADNTRSKVQVNPHPGPEKDAEAKKADAAKPVNLTAEQHLTTEPRKPPLKVKFSLKQR